MCFNTFGAYTSNLFFLKIEFKENGGHSFVFYVAFVNKQNTRWFKYDRDYLCVNKSQFVPVIFEPPCISYIHNNQMLCAFGWCICMIDENAQNTSI
jgi:hypothetical protein